MSVTTMLGWLGTALVLVAYAQPSARRLRVVSLLASVVLIAFNGVLGIWSNVALEVALVVVNVVQLARQPTHVGGGPADCRRASRYRTSRSRPGHPHVDAERQNHDRVSPARSSG